MAVIRKSGLIPRRTFGSRSAPRRLINDVTEVLHKIEAKLYPNYLGKSGGTYVARARPEAPLAVAGVCAAAKNRGGFTGQYEDLGKR